MSELLHGIDIETPVGVLRAVASAGALVSLRPAEGAPEVARTNDHPILTRLRAQLSAYFAGDLAPFDLPCAPAGTSLQKDVWAELARVRPGTTISYGALAARLGRPNASRAVGAANGRNPIAIVIPCHRVVGRSGALTGYAWGLDRKAWLLRHEAARAPE